MGTKFRKSTQILCISLFMEYCSRTAQFTTFYYLLFCSSNHILRDWTSQEEKSYGELLEVNHTTQDKYIISCTTLTFSKLIEKNIIQIVTLFFPSPFPNENQHISSVFPAAAFLNFSTRFSSFSHFVYGSTKTN